VLFKPIALLNVLKSVIGEAPKTTLACKTPAASYRLTASPPVLKPIPDP
jgi:hypothetical protein